jgi:dihydroorotase-like cyclic amidohydrolase
MLIRRYGDKKLYEELICLLSLHKLTVDNIQCHHLHTQFHQNPPIGSKVTLTSEV